MEYIVDRIENGYVVCECMGQMYNIDINKFDTDIKENDIVRLIDGKYIVDYEKREQRKKEIIEKMNDVWEN